MKDWANPTAEELEHWARTPDAMWPVLSLTSLSPGRLILIAPLLLAFGCAHKGPAPPQPAPTRPPLAFETNVPNEGSTKVYRFQVVHIKRPDPHLPIKVRQQFPKGTSVTGAYKVCYDTSGRVTEVKPVQSIAGADDAIARHILSEWTFGPLPYPLATAGMGACYLQVFRFTIPPVEP